jgi:hypothetical protein
MPDWITQHLEESVPKTSVSYQHDPLRIRIQSLLEFFVTLPTMQMKCHKKRKYTVVSDPYGMVVPQIWIRQMNPMRIRI